MVLTMSLLGFWVWNISVSLMSFIKNILICILKISEGLTGLERHEGEFFSFFGWTIPLISMRQFLESHHTEPEKIDCNLQWNEVDFFLFKSQ